MTETLSLLQTAEQADIPLFVLDLSETGSMSVQSDTGRGYIGLDYGTLMDEASIRVHLSHELGHCLTASFYNRYSPYDCRQRHENRANGWSYQKLVPEDELWAAMAHGYTTSWELAEFFTVTEDFLQRAFAYYHAKTLADVCCREYL